MVISHEADTNAESVTIMISNSVFSQGSQALSVLLYPAWSGHIMNISFCSFLDNKVMDNSSLVTISLKSQPDRGYRAMANIKDSHFENNSGSSVCTNLNVSGITKVNMQNVNIANTFCTSISLFSTPLYVLNTLNLSNNTGDYGGGIEMRKKWHGSISRIVLNKNSRVLIRNNTALFYGGGVFTDQTCKDVHYGSRERYCFFKFNRWIKQPAQLLTFSGNKAEVDGNSSFGGCLSDCSLEFNDHATIRVNIHDPENIFWTFVSAENQSPSGFAEAADGVIFCGQTDSNSSLCDVSHEVSVFRGESFSVSLMVVDYFCFPSFELPKVIRATVLNNSDSVHLNSTHLTIADPCQDYHFFVTADLGLNETSVEFSLLEGVAATLAVQLTDCPLGFAAKGSNVPCTCRDEWQHYSVKCNSTNFELSVPAEMWVGVPRQRDDYFIVQHDCKFCKNDGVQVMKVSSGIQSGALCLPYREGTLCGNCIDGHSFQLGGYECADCSKSTGTGVLLLLLFAALGAILIILLLCLNLTVATGRINGLIFYSHIIYLNLDSFLRVTSTSPLQNVVRALSTFQAWMNLDFGITTCFFPGYNAYSSTWMGFVFPVYIWLLVLLIVIISKYSSRVSKLTGSNTVPVLATLLLLSYTKVIRTSVQVYSSVKLHSLSGNEMLQVWALDGNLPFASRSHFALLLAGMALIALYIIPFTLLILLGPLLLAKSHFRPLRWVQRVMPFLDAFYGPHEVRYWPGLLLLARLALFCTFALDWPPQTKYLAVSCVIVVLLIIWIVAGGRLYRKTHVNNLEIFFLANLLLFATISQYFQSTTTSTSSRKEPDDNSVHRLQILAVIMVGSAFVVFLGILISQILLVIAKYKLLSAIVSRYRAGRRQAADSEVIVKSDTNPHDKKASTPTHSEIELKQCVSSSGKKVSGTAAGRVPVKIEFNEPRERLLTNN